MADIIKKKYKVIVYDDNGGLLFLYETDDFDQALKVSDALKGLFDDTSLMEH